MPENVSLFGDGIPHDNDEIDEVVNSPITSQPYQAVSGAGAAARALSASFHAKSSKGASPSPRPGQSPFPAFGLPRRTSSVSEQKWYKVATSGESSKSTPFQSKLLDRLDTSEHKGRSDPLSPTSETDEQTRMSDYRPPFARSKEDATSSTAASESEAGPSQLPGSRRSLPAFLSAIKSPTSPVRQPSSPTPEISSTVQLITDLWPPPPRRIFMPGEPTAFVSRSTAQVDMTSHRQVSDDAVLVDFGASTSDLPSTSNTLQRSIVESSQASGVRKDSENPILAAEERFPSIRSSTKSPIAISRLFAGGDMATPGPSRHGSYLRGTPLSKASTRFDSPPVTAHLYQNGLLSGKHSDIKVHAFGTSYALHRLLLDRAPFFSTALSGPWTESSAKEIELHPQEVDANITQAAFELALKRIYGCYDSDQEDQEAIGLFAVGCWLEMDDLVEASIASLLRQMDDSKLSEYINFATGSYYGRNGDRILSSAKAMLCRNGWEMKVRYWDGIPGDIVQEVVGSDGFFVPGEWERWALVRRLLNRRLRKAGRENMLVEEGASRPVLPAKLTKQAIRMTGLYKDEAYLAKWAGSEELASALAATYADKDVAPLMTLIDEGIYYIHLSFEQLQKIREQKDALGLPLLPEKVISGALWSSMELRQKVVNADAAELELGLVEKAEAEQPSIDTIANRAADNPSVGAIDNSKVSGRSARSLGKRPTTAGSDALPSEPSSPTNGSWDDSGQSRKFWVPESDATFLLNESGRFGYGEVNAGNRAGAQKTNTARDISLATGDSMDSGTGLNDSDSRSPSPTIATIPSPKIQFSQYAPFRFAVEFPAPRSLKEGKRVYSPTVWYAGSLWNVYVQKKHNQRGAQLGIYLHRQRISNDNVTEELFAASYTRQGLGVGGGASGAGGQGSRSDGNGRRGGRRAADTDDGLDRLERAAQLRQFRERMRAAEARLAVDSEADLDGESQLINDSSDMDALISVVSRSDRSANLIAGSRRVGSVLSKLSAGSNAATFSSPTLALSSDDAIGSFGNYSSSSINAQPSLPRLASDTRTTRTIPTSSGILKTNNADDIVTSRAYQSDSESTTDEQDSEEEEMLRLWNHAQTPHTWAANALSHAYGDKISPTPTQRTDNGPRRPPKLRARNNQTSSGNTHNRHPSSGGNGMTSATAAAIGSVNATMLKSKRLEPTLPPYVDSRPTIRTYFKIYAPSHGGRVITAYESQPDNFNFSQSWGWKSANLVFDDEDLFLPEQQGDVGMGMVGEKGVGSGSGVSFQLDEGRAQGQRAMLSNDAMGRLRFMVVVGNV